MYSVTIHLGFYRNTIYFKYYKTENVLTTRMHVTEPTMTSDKQLTLPCIFLMKIFQWRNSKLVSIISYQAQQELEIIMIWVWEQGPIFPRNVVFIDLYHYYLSQWTMGKFKN